MRRFFELRQAGDRRLAGTVMRYGDVAQIGAALRERFEPGAFAPIGDVILNAAHDRATPLARTDGGGLDLADSRGALELVADLPETTAANDVLALVRSGVLRGFSVEFLALRERFEGDLRVVERARLGGVAIVDRPAYPDSEVEARRALFEAAAKSDTSPMPERRRRIWL